MLPSEYRIDYELLMCAARLESGANISLFLQEQLPLKWRDAYMATIRRQSNVVRIRLRTFEYICDVYSEMEILGEVSFDQTSQDRVIAVLGTSAREEERRDFSRMRRWGGLRMN
ncbi:MAG TPA: hypothetical protein VLK33_08835 [Terriglobales bacterium]|nr:hypothetical protein [Terriglobales bacterium]